MTTLGNLITAKYLNIKQLEKEKTGQFKYLLDLLKTHKDKLLGGLNPMIIRDICSAVEAAEKFCQKDKDTNMYSLWQGLINPLKNFAASLTETYAKEKTWIAPEVYVSEYSDIAFQLSSCDGIKGWELKYDQDRFLIVSKKYTPEEKDALNAGQKEVCLALADFIKNTYGLTLKPEELEKYTWQQALEDENHKPYLRLIFDIQQLVTKIFEHRKTPANGVAEAKQTVTTNSDGFAAIVEVAFVFDITASMGAQIKAAKEAICEIQKDLEKEYEGALVRFACIAYRDYKDQDRLKVRPFTTAKQMEKFLLSLKAEGGDDLPEMTERAFEELCNLDWSKSNDFNKQNLIRVVVAISDSLPHGLPKAYYEQNGERGNYDSYSRETIEDGLYWETSLNKVMKTLSPSVHTLTCTPDHRIQNTTLAVHKEIAKIGNGTQNTLSEVKKFKEEIINRVRFDAQQDKLGRRILANNENKEATSSEAIAKAAANDAQLKSMFKEMYGDSSDEQLAKVAGATMARYARRDPSRAYEPPKPKSEELVSAAIPDKVVPPKEGNLARIAEATRKSPYARREPSHTDEPPKYETPVFAAVPNIVVPPSVISRSIHEVHAPAKIAPFSVASISVHVPLTETKAGVLENKSLTASTALEVKTDRTMLATLPPALNQADFDKMALISRQLEMQLFDLASKRESLAKMQEQLQSLESQAKTAAATSDPALPIAIARLKAKIQEENEQAYIEKDPDLYPYFLVFRNKLNAMFTACIGISSGMIANDESTKLGYLASGIDKLGESIPGLSLLTAILTVSLKAYDNREKAICILKLFKFFADHHEIGQLLNTLAIKVTLAQIKKLKEKSAINTKDGLVNKLRAAKNKLLVNDIDTPTKELAIEHIGVVLKSIYEGELSKKENCKQTDLPTIFACICPGVDYATVIVPASANTPVVVAAKPNATTVSVPVVPNASISTGIPAVVPANSDSTTTTAAGGDVTKLLRYVRQLRQKNEDLSQRVETLNREHKDTVSELDKLRNNNPTSPAGDGTQVFATSPAHANGAASTYELTQLVARQADQISRLTDQVALLSDPVNASPTNDPSKGAVSISPKNTM